MVCPGIVTNVTNFGAFVDIGVHQDGLVHISQLSDSYVKDPRESVSPGDRVQVRVLEVNLDKGQIALTMKGLKEKRRGRDGAGREGGRAGGGRGRDRGRGREAAVVAAPPGPPPDVKRELLSRRGRRPMLSPRKPGKLPNVRPKEAFNNPFGSLKDMLKKK